MGMTDFFDDLANAAADEALTVLLTELHTFQGRSRFTTWAVKFAIVPTATEVGRPSRASREGHLPD
jgi:RNA polymerase sigma-70 factor, ECF subfamily